MTAAKGQDSQLRRLQLDRACFRLEGTHVVPRPGPLAVGATLVAPGLAEAVGFCLHQPIERLLRPPPDNLVQV